MLHWNTEMDKDFGLKYTEQKKQKQSVEPIQPQSPTQGQIR